MFFEKLLETFCMVSTFKGQPSHGKMWMRPRDMVFDK